MTDFLTLQENKRVPSIDRYRGLLLALMIAFGAAKMFEAIPFFGQFSTHDLSAAFLLLPGYAVYDIGAPIFVFVSGLSFGLSFNSLERRRGTRNAMLTLLARGFKTIGVGSLLLFAPSDAVGIISIVLLGLAILLAAVWAILASLHKHVNRLMGTILHIFLLAAGIALVAVGVLDNVLYAAGLEVAGTHWDALASIGFSMLVALPFVRLGTTRKVLGAFALTLFYWALNVLVPADFFMHWTHGGLLGAFGYALLFYYAMTLVELAAKNKPMAYLFALILSVAAFFAFTVMIPSKAAVNLSYVLTSFLFAYFIYLVIQCFDGIPSAPTALLTLLGRNSLLTYLIHSFVTFPAGICINALIAYLPIEGVIPILLAFICMALYVLLMAHWIRLLNRKGFSLKM